MHDEHAECCKRSTDGSNCTLGAHLFTLTGVPHMAVKPLADDSEKPRVRRSLEPNHEGEMATTVLVVGPHIIFGVGCNEACTVHAPKKEDSACVPPASCKVPEVHFGRAEDRHGSEVSHR